MKRIPLNKGQFALVDDEDFDSLNQHTWYVNCRGYVRSTINKRQTDGTWKTKSISMHRVVLSSKKGQSVDHINLNKLDNRKANLRHCSYGENNINRGVMRNNKSGFKGVRLAKKSTDKWYAEIHVGRKVVYIGTFRDPKDAARAYNATAQKYYGEFAWLNPV